MAARGEPVWPGPAARRRRGGLRGSGGRIEWLSLERGNAGGGPTSAKNGDDSGSGCSTGGGSRPRSGSRSRGGRRARGPGGAGGLRPAGRADRGSSRPWKSLRGFGANSSPAGAIGVLRWWMTKRATRRRWPTRWPGPDGLRAAAALGGACGLGPARSRPRDALAAPWPVADRSCSSREVAVDADGWPSPEWTLAAAGIPARSAASLDEALSELDRHLEPGDVLLTLGAGDVGTIADAFIRRLPRDRPGG